MTIKLERAKRWVDGIGVAESAVASFLCSCTLGEHSGRNMYTEKAQRGQQAHLY